MHPRHVSAFLLLTLLAACSGAPAPTTDSGASAAATPGPGAQANAETRIGDVSIRASAIQTSQLDARIARQYGLQRDPNTVLLLVTVDRGPRATADAMPSSIQATATDLRGSRQPLALHEVRSGDAIDYIGTTATSLPDTLRFEIEIVRAGGARSTMSMSRDFYPR